MEPGKVVEFIEGRNFVTAVVTRVKGNKLLVLSETDREMNISGNRVLQVNSASLNPSQSRLDLVRRLKEISDHRAELGRSLDLVELWELLEGEGEEFAYEFLAGLAWTGPVTGDQVAAVQRAVFSDGLYFKMKPTEAVRHSADKVEEINQLRLREEERERELAEGGAWLNRVWEDKPAEEPDSGPRVIRLLRDTAVHGSEAPEYKLTKQFLERAGLNQYPTAAFRLLVKLGEMGRHENLDLIRENLATDFSPQILAEAENLARRKSWRDQERRDLTYLNVLTADSGGARDFDDAVSLEEKDGRLVLGVHIADVSAVITPDSPLDLEARERVTSIYMPDRRIPMLPEVLSEECLSLKVDEVRPAFSLLAELNEAGEVLSFEFLPSLIKVKRQLSYQEVDAAVHQDLTLSRMYKLSLALKERRVAQGALILPLPKMNVYLTPEGEIGVSLTLWENPGRAMITEFMILTNFLAARQLTDKEAPCYYRTQNEPTERIVPGDTDCSDLFLCLKQRRHLSRVAWGLEPLPHSGMGLEVYTNLTSPLRRYLDLVIQRQIRAINAQGSPRYDLPAMEDMLTQTEVVRRKAFKLQNKRKRYWLLRYLKIQPQNDHEALVLERLPRRWRIFLTDLMMDADLPPPPGRNLEPGQTISVRIKKIDPREDILKFELN